MTPIKVGALVEVARVHGETSYTVFSWPGDAVGIGKYRTLPMALRAAAAAAGIERQRVRWVRVNRKWVAENPRSGRSGCTLLLVEEIAGQMADVPDWRTLDSIEFRWIGDRAHEYARERYAAHGGAS